MTRHRGVQIRRAQTLSLGPTPRATAVTAAPNHTVAFMFLVCSFYSRDADTLNIKSASTLSKVFIVSTATKLKIQRKLRYS